jgi:hypothetical protein
MSFALSALLALATLAAAPPTKLANAGDSISQGFASRRLGDDPEVSWVQGTHDRADPVFLRYLALNPDMEQGPESVSGARMIDGTDGFADQVERICAQRPVADRVYILLGGNDVCGVERSAGNPLANLPTVDAWSRAVRGGLERLAGCLPAGAAVHLMSMPRVDFLYEAGEGDGWCQLVRRGICAIVTDEPDPARRAAIGRRVDQYNEASRRELADIQGDSGRNPRGIQFGGDWQGSIDDGFADTSVGSHRFGAGDLSPIDCFHPSVTAQRKIACVAWETGPDGRGDLDSCLE